MRLSTKVAIIVPSLGRPHRIAETIENVAATAPNARVHFVVEETDTETVEALDGARATIGNFGTYGLAVNAGYQDCDEPVVMTSDDDVEYGEGWLEAALKVMKGKIRVVGTNDGFNPHVLAGKHSTHSLIDRRYIDDIGGVVDMPPGTILYPYDHNYTDAELIETATARGVFAPCLESICTHIHPEFGGREPDPTWQKTRRAVVQDHALFSERRSLWQPDSPLLYPAPS